MSLVEAAMRTVAGLLLVRLCGCGAIELTVGSMIVCDVVQVVARAERWALVRAVGARGKAAIQ